MNKHKRIIGFLLLVSWGLAIGAIRPFASTLNWQGHIVVMSLIITAALWIFTPWKIPIGVSACFFPAVLLAAGLPMSTVFSGFTQTATWVLIPALFFGFALAKTGLGKRIVYFVLKQVQISYPSLLLMWSIIGIALSLLTPSVTVRVAIVTPLALDCVEICNIKKGSKGRSLILLTAWSTAVIPGMGWSTGSLMGPILTGIFASVDGIPAITFSSWLRVGLLPATIITALMVPGGYLILRPEEELSICKEAFQEEYKKLPYFSKQEKLTGIILLVSFFMLATHSWHGIPDAAVCMIALVALSLSGIVQAQDISNGISWNLVLFVGMSMSFGTVFVATGVSSWLSSLLMPLFSPIAQNPWVFVIVVLVFLFAWRFIDVALLTPTIILITPALPALGKQFGINPLVWIPIFCMASNAFFMSYENMFCLVAETNMLERSWTPKHLFRYGMVYFASCILAMSVSIPYWESIGMFNFR